MVIFIYIVLIFITTLFILQLSPITFFKGTKNLVKTGGKREKPEKEEDKKPSTENNNNVVIIPEGADKSKDESGCGSVVNSIGAMFGVMMMVASITINKKKVGK